MGTPPIFLAGTQGERIESDTSISLCGLPLFFVGTLLVAPKLPAMLRDTAGGGVRHLCSIVVSASLLYFALRHPAMLRGTAETEFCATLLLCDFAGKIKSI